MVFYRFFGWEQSDVLFNGERFSRRKYYGKAKKEEYSESAGFIFWLGFNTDDIHAGRYYRHAG